MSKGVKSKAQEKTTSFAKEIIGMATVLFCVLCFLCVVTGDSLFYTLGKGVQSFFLGIFGVYSLIALVHIAEFGLRLVLGKSIVPDDKKLVVFAIRTAVVCLFAIVHLALNYNSAEIVWDSVSRAYGLGGGGFSSVTPYGAVGALMTIPLAKIASIVGVYLIYSVVLFISLFFIFKKHLIKMAESVQPTEKERKAKKVKQNAQPTATQASAEVPQTFMGETNDFGQEAETPQTRSGFFFNETPFALKTKKELASGMKNTYLFPSEQNDLESKQRKPYVVSSQGSQSAYQSTPPTQRTVVIDKTRKVDLSEIGQSPIHVTEPVQRPVRQEKNLYDTSSQGKEVYTIKTPSMGMAQNQPQSQTQATERVVRESTVPTERRGLFDDTSVMRERAKQAQNDAFSSQSASVQKPKIEPVETSTSEQSSGDKLAPTNIPFASMNSTKTEVREFARGLTEEQSAPKAPSQTTAKRTPSQTEFTQISLDGEDEKLESTRVRGARQTVAQPQVERPRGMETVFQSQKPKYTMPDDGSDDISNMPAHYRYKAPPLSLLKVYEQDKEALWQERERQKWCAEKIVSVIKNKSKIDVEVVNIVSGPAITRYDIKVPEDVMTSEIFSCKNELSFRLETGGELRMYNIPFTSLIGIEVANRNKRIVGMKEVITSKAYVETKDKKGYHFIFGQDVLGNSIFFDLASLPHLLVCGTTGSGKSVCLNTLLVSLMYRYSPEQLRMIIIDPKRLDFTRYKGSPHLVFNDILAADDRALLALDWVVSEMERRYEMLSSLMFGDLASYNKYAIEKGEKPLPYLLVMIDEFADLMQAAPQNAKKVEHCVGRIAQKARAAGISLVLATQRPDVKTISGSIKVNFASRFCFKVASGIDSRVIINEDGAEKLLGNGDALYVTSKDSILKRAQGAYLSNEELDEILRYIKENNKCYFDKGLLETINAKANGEAEEETNSNGSSSPRGPIQPSEADEDYKRAIRLAIVRQEVSNSMLRTYLRFGYNKAATIVIWMERMGYVSPALDNKARKVFITQEQYEEIFGEFVKDW